MHTRTYWAAEVGELRRECDPSSGWDEDSLSGALGQEHLGLDGDQEVLEPTIVDAPPAVRE